MAASRRSAFSLRLRYLRTPAASSMIRRRSSGRALSTASIWPWLTITCCWRPTPVSDSSSWMSSRRHGTPLMAYSLSPVRNSVRVIVTSVNSIGSRPAELSMVSATSARPSAGRLAVPAKMTSSIFCERTARRRLGAEHPADGVDDVGLARSVRPDDHGDAGLELQGGGVGEGLEALQGERLEEHASVDASAAANPRRAPWAGPSAGRRDGREPPAVRFRGCCSSEPARVSGPSPPMPDERPGRCPDPPGSGTSSTTSWRTRETRRSSSRPPAPVTSVRRSSARRIGARPGARPAPRRSSRPGIPSSGPSTGCSG